MRTLWLIRNGKITTSSKDVTVGRKSNVRNSTVRSKVLTLNNDRYVWINNKSYSGVKRCFIVWKVWQQYLKLFIYYYCQIKDIEITSFLSGVLSSLTSQKIDIFRSKVVELVRREHFTLKNHKSMTTQS